MPIDCASAPCGSCPYRKDTPSGVWHESEYAKLREYQRDDGETPCLAVFLCHQTNATGRETVCRGWLTVEQHSIAVRLALMKGDVTPEQVYAAPLVPLYASGEEAAASGLAGVKNLSRKARRLQARLLAKGAAKGY